MQGGVAGTGRVRVGALLEQEHRQLAVPAMRRHDGGTGAVWCRVVDIRPGRH